MTDAPANQKGDPPITDDINPDEVFEWSEMTDEALAELASGELRRVRTPDGRDLLMTRDEIRAAIEYWLEDREEDDD